MRIIMFLVSLALVVWLAIGAAAAGQRHYYSGSLRTALRRERSP
jgi:hypothetical protein